MIIGQVCGIATQTGAVHFFAILRYRWCGSNCM